MAIIDLETGSVTDAPVDTPENLPQPVQEQPESRGIINLETGQFETQQEAVQEPAQQAPEGGMFDFFTGSAAKEQTPELATLPEFGTTEEGDTFRISFGMLSTFNEKAQKDIIQEAIPEAVFETTPDGSTIIEAPTKEGGTRRSVLNRPGFSPQDANTATAQVLAFLPVTKAAALAETLKGKFVTAFFGGGTIEQGMQEGGILAGRKERDPTETLLASGISGVAETFLPFIQAFRKGRQAAKLGAEKQTVEQAIDEIRPLVEAQEGLEKATGQKVGLFQAQQTQLPSSLLKQRILPQLDAGSKIAMDALEAQDKEVFEATMSLVNQLAPEGIISTGSKAFRDASQKALKDARQLRSDTVSPLYKAAFNEAKQTGKTVDLGPVKAFVRKELKNLVDDDPAAIGLKSFLERLEGVTAKQTKPGLIVDTAGDAIIQTKTRPISLEKLQSAKFTTEAQIDKIAEQTSSANARAKRALREANKIYVEQLGKVSGKFKAANEEFARLSPRIDELEESIIGQVSKVKDSNIKDISQKIFNPKTELTDPTSIRNAKKVIDKADPNAWNDLLRVEVGRRLGGLSEMADIKGDVPGSLLRTLFGNPSQRKALLAGMSKEQRQNFKYLETVLKRASSGRAAGSPTEGFRRATEKLRGSALVIWESIFKPLATIKEAGVSGVFDRNARAAARVAFDPKFKPQLSKLKKMDQNLPEAARAMTQLLRQAAEEDEAK